MAMSSGRGIFVNVLLVDANGVIEDVDLIVQCASRQQRFAGKFPVGGFGRNPFMLGGGTLGLTVLTIDEGQLFGCLGVEFVFRVRHAKFFENVRRLDPVLELDQCRRSVVFS